MAPVRSHAHGRHYPPPPIDTESGDGSDACVPSTTARGHGGHVRPRAVRALVGPRNEALAPHCAAVAGGTGVPPPRSSAGPPRSTVCPRRIRIAPPRIRSGPRRRRSSSSREQCSPSEAQGSSLEEQWTSRQGHRAALAGVDDPAQEGLAPPESDDLPARGPRPHHAHGPFDAPPRPQPRGRRKLPASGCLRHNRRLTFALDAALFPPDS